MNSVPMVPIFEYENVLVILVPVENKNKVLNAFSDGGNVYGYVGWWMGHFHVKYGLNFRMYDPS